VDENTRICHYFLQGQCKWGDKCHYLHSETPTNEASQVAPAHCLEEAGWSWEYGWADPPRDTSLDALSLEDGEDLNDEVSPSVEEPPETPIMASSDTARFLPSRYDSLVAQYEKLWKQKIQNTASQQISTFAEGEKCLDPTLECSLNNQGDSNAYSGWDIRNDPWENGWTRDADGCINNLASNSVTTLPESGFHSQDLSWQGEVDARPIPEWELGEDRLSLDRCGWSADPWVAENDAVEEEPIEDWSYDQGSGNVTQHVNETCDDAAWSVEGPQEGEADSNWASGGWTREADEPSADDAQPNAPLATGSEWQTDDSGWGFGDGESQTTVEGGWAQEARTTQVQEPADASVSHIPDTSQSLPALLQDLQKNSRRYRGRGPRNWRPLNTPKASSQSNRSKQDMVSWEYQGWVDADERSSASFSTGTHISEVYLTRFHLSFLLTTEIHIVFKAFCSVVTILHRG
jgi:hypothetical protein